MQPLFRDLVSDLRSRWRSLMLTDVAYKVISLVLLTPLTVALFQILLQLSGATLLADQDILFYLLGPAGWLCLITIGAIWIGIVALELAALFAILRVEGQQVLGPIAAIRFATTHAWPVAQVTSRMMAYGLLCAAPFLIVAGLVYWTLLTDFDINYYLKQRPPKFQIAVAIGVVLSAGLLAVALRLAANWFFALPLVLLEGVAPANALSLSRQRVAGKRSLVLTSIVIWFLASTAASALVSWLVVLIGRTIIPSSASSLGTLTIAIGIALLVWSIAGLAVNVLSMVSYALMHLNLYRRYGADQQAYQARLPEFNQTDHWLSQLRLTGGRLIAVCVVLILLAAGVGIAATRGVQVNDDVQVIAHRGASAAAPENTMAAIQRAIEDQTDWVEIDVQETADGEVVVFHDSDFMKLAGNPRKIWDATGPQLQQIDIGSWFDPSFQDQRVPTLEQVLQRCQGKVGVNIELKYYGHDQQLEQRVVNIVESTDMQDQVVFMSLKLAAVEKMKSIRPNWTVGLLMSVSAGDLAAIEADFLAVNASFANRSFINRAHRAGKDVFVWTVNDPVTMSSLIGRGVDGLITDEPALARRVLQERAKMRFTERLLLQLADTFGVEHPYSQQ